MRKITGRIWRIVLVVPCVVFPFMASSCRTAISACPKLLALSLLRCFLASLLLSSPAGWRGARRRIESCRWRKESSAAVLVFLLMASPPATRSGPPTGVLTGVPERRPCSYRLSEILPGAKAPFSLSATARLKSCPPIPCFLHKTNELVHCVTGACLVCAARWRWLPAKRLGSRRPAHRRCCRRCRPERRSALRPRQRNSCRPSAPS